MSTTPRASKSAPACTAGDRVITPSTDPILLRAYRCGQVIVLLVAALFVSVHGVITAGSGLVIALVAFRVFYAVMCGVVFPVIEELSRAVVGRL